MDKQDKFFNISHYHNKFILEPVEAALKAFPFEMGDGVKINLQRKAFIRGYQTAEHNIHSHFTEVEKEKWDLLAWAILNDYSYDDEGDQWFEVVRLNPYTTEKISKEDMYKKFKQQQSKNKND